MIFRSSPKSQSGNIFFALFGAVALVGILAAAATSFMKGPLATSVKLTKMNSAETQMSVGAQIAVMASANQANSGDCDLDGFVEPIEWRDAGASPKPTNGGLIPMTVGISKKDPWGTEYGYCVWNHGTITSGSGCNANLLAGTNSKAYQVAALVSAGPDKAFTTTCRTFATADANSDGDLLDAGDSPLISKAAETDDDIIFSYTYDEATGASGGLWSIKSGDPNTAVINKKIETTGAANLKGGILLPDKSLVTCDASNAGVMAMNSNAIEICDGTAWTPITGGISGSGLVLTPNVSSGMNITAPCGAGTCYSSNVTFVLANRISPAATSDPITVTLSNTNNFEKISDTCNGTTLATNASCQIIVRAKATGDRMYSGVLQITGNNAPFATLDGTATGFGCIVGGDAPGGKYAACGVSGYNLIVTPSGCTSTTNNPTCAGGPDTATVVSYNGTFSNDFTTAECCSNNGQLNTANLNAYSYTSLNYDSIQWCNSLEFQGFSDWFLPSSSELTTYFYPNRVALGSAASGSYLSSYAYNAPTGGQVYAMNIVGGGLTGVGAGYSGLVRCMRWDPAKSVTVSTDTTPRSVTFNPSSTTTASQVLTSNTVTIAGITSPITVSISGGTSSAFSVNGGSYVTSATVNNGDTLTLRSTSPVAGAENTVNVTLGSSGATWRVRTVANNTIYAFTTAGTYQGNFGGASGADTICNNEAAAAGLSGSWIGLIQTGFGANDGPASRLPWNWTTMRNMNNQVVASSYDDFVDGSLSAAINRTAANGSPSTSQVWTGGNATGLGIYYASYSYACGSPPFTATSGAFGGIGNNASTASHFYTTTTPDCSNYLALYCVLDPGGGVNDVDPNPVAIVPAVTFTSGGTATSNTVTIRGILQAATVTITPSAGTAIIIKGGVSTGSASTTVMPNETLAFSLTAPTVLGTKNTATIAIGPDTYNWWVGYADSSKQVKAFVTSSTSYDANLGGIAGANAACTTAAASSPLGLSSSWKAVISNSSTDAASNIAWNWGIMKTVTGTTIVDGGYQDLWDGTLDGPLNVDQNGNTVSGRVLTGTDEFGAKYAPTGINAYYAGYCQELTYGNTSYWLITGNVGSLNAQWVNNNAGYCGYGDYYRLYCVEDVDTSSDTTPNELWARYPVQVPTSSRQTSEAVVVSGMSSSATQTLSVSAPSGTPRFKKNGGPEVSSDTIQNGDSIVFVMDAPASGNSFNKMTITAGGMTSYWRVWTGDPTGSAVKRVFIRYWGWGGFGTNQGGITGLDALCQSAATAASLGGTWKAIASGVGNDENQFAVNRIGYNWSTLRRIDGQDVVLAGNIWKTDTTPLLAPIAITQTGTTASTSYVSTGSDVRGMAAVKLSTGQCVGYSNSTAGNNSSYTNYRGTSGVTSSAWVNNGSGGSFYGCHDYEGDSLYCIEQ